MDNSYNKKNSSKKSRIFLLDYKIFSILLFMIPFYLFRSPFLDLLGTFAILIIFLLGIYDTFLRSNKIIISRIWFWFFIYFLYNSIMLLRTPTYEGLYTLILQNMLLLFLCLFSSTRIDEVGIRNIFKACKTLCITLVVIALIDNLDILRINQYFNAVLYKTILATSFFFIANSRKKLLYILIFSLIFFIIQERTSAIVLLIIYGVYLLLPTLAKLRTLYNIFFSITFISLIVFAYLYVQMQYMNIGRLLTELSIKYTGALFFSGRNEVWELAFSYILRSPLWGYGIDNNILILSGITLSTHNTYIFILLQGGVVGLTIFFLFMYSVWKKFYDSLDNDIVRLSASYLIGVLVFINFEVTLIGNTVVTAIYLWFILGIGLVQRNNLKN